MDYKYYVYVGPGHIRYFDDWDQAISYADYYDVHVNDIELDKSTESAES